mmetsp:Transcript_2363/g.5112  ORF Transcript_2363/g.5112 Transcript_2363/m.5112 type:complete len:205 (-) Transcript_2363:124-738(-)
MSTGFDDISKEWDDTASVMEEILSVSNDSDGVISSVRRSIAILSTLGEGKDLLRRQAREISQSVNSKIESEKKAVQHESDELSGQIQRVQQLEEEVERLEKFTADIVAKRRQTEQNIPVLKAEAAEVIDEVDEIQMRHIKEVPKIKMRYSLFANMTNVKWDYSRTNVLAGEVSIPSKAVHKQFEIPKNIPEFEIAEMFWNVIEG